MAAAAEINKQPIRFIHDDRVAVLVEDIPTVVSLFKKLFDKHVKDWSLFVCRDRETAINALCSHPFLDSATKQWTVLQNVSIVFLDNNFPKTPKEELPSDDQGKDVALQVHDFYQHHSKHHRRPSLGAFSLDSPEKFGPPLFDFILEGKRFNPHLVQSMCDAGSKKALQDWLIPSPSPCLEQIFASEAT